MKWIDLPPVWLAGFLFAAWGLGTPDASAWASWLGAGVALAGGALIGLAALEFARARTTIIPHQTPQRMISSGVFALSRNPIYLGDTLILAGLCLRWEALAGVVLVPVFVWIITRRFIVPEEARLAREFGPAFTAYSAGVRRWI